MGKPRTRYQLYTPEEDAIIRERWLAWVPAKVIARELGRCPDSVYYRIRCVLKISNQRPLHPSRVRKRDRLLARNTHPDRWVPRAPSHLSGPVWGYRWAEAWYFFTGWGAPLGSWVEVTGSLYVRGTIRTGTKTLQEAVRLVTEAVRTGKLLGVPPQAGLSHEDHQPGH